MIRSLLKRWKGGMPEDSAASTASVVPGERPPADSRERARSLVMALQDEICAGLEQIDGSGRFQEESWGSGLRAAAVAPRDARRPDLRAGRCEFL